MSFVTKCPKRLVQYDFKAISDLCFQWLKNQSYKDS
jgi:hypothetical protein